MISADTSDPGIFSVTLVTGLATALGTLRCQGSMLRFLGSVCGLCASATAPASVIRTAARCLFMGRHFTHEFPGHPAGNPDPGLPDLAYSCASNNVLARVEAIYA